MSYDKNIKILAFVGLAGSGKTTAVNYLADKGFPKVTHTDASQIDNLENAGQHHIIEDGPSTWQQYKELKEQFHSDLIVIGLIANKHLRHHRLTVRENVALTETEATERDWHEIENDNIGGVIAFADHFISNNGNLEDFYASIDAVLEEIEFRV
jgi:dephospho-CoA kinase